MRISRTNETHSWKRWSERVLPILASASAMIILGCTKSTPILRPEFTGICRAPSFEEFCSSRRAHLLSKGTDRFGLDAGQGWLVGFPERCEIFAKIPPEWPGECIGLEGGEDAATVP